MFHAVNVKANIWHRRLGHLRTTMMRQRIPLLIGHTLCERDPKNMAECTACIKGKLIRRPSRWTLPKEMPRALHPLQGDICGPINPAACQFKYFLVLVDALRRNAEVSLLTTRNMAFPKTLAMILKFKNNFSENHISFLKMDNALEFKSRAFEDFCIASRIKLTYFGPYDHAQNGLAEAYIKKIQLIVCPVLFHAHFPPTM